MLSVEQVGIKVSMFCTLYMLVHHVQPQTDHAFLNVGMNTGQDDDKVTSKNLSGNISYCTPTGRPNHK